jgi:hypothetical protein
MADSHSIEEVWRPIPGLDGLYDVSTFGRVRSYWSRRGKLGPARVRVLTRDGGGYLRLTVVDSQGRARTEKVHQLVAKTFLGPANALEVNHRDGVRDNNRLDNLEYVTRHGNMRDAVKRRGIWGGLTAKHDERRSKTHCVYGHPFDAENTVPGKHGGRGCRECMRRRGREATRRYRARH